MGLDAVVKAIPIKFSFGGSSSQERLQNFCRTYDARVKQYTAEQIDSSTGVREALTSFVKCIEVASKGIQFYPQIGRTSLAVDVRRGSDDAKLEGLQYDTALLTCRIPGPNGTGLVQAQGKTNRQLDGNYLPIACARLPRTGEGGVQYYPEADLTILTNRGSLILKVLRTRKYLISWLAISLGDSPSWRQTRGSSWIRWAAGESWRWRK
jgi:hypothetical protein